MSTEALQTVEINPGNANQPGGFQAGTFSTTVAVSNTAGTVFSIAGPVHAVPFNLFNNGGTLSLRALGGTDTASVGATAFVGFCLSTSATQWFLAAATGDRAAVILALTVPATATSGTSIVTVGGAKASKQELPLALHAQQILSITAEAAVTATLAWTGNMYWRK